MSVKSFIMYESWQEQINILTDEEAGQLLKAIYNYNLHNIEPEFTDRMMMMLFSVMKREFNTQKENYNNKVKANRENGKKGGRPKTHDNPKNPVGYLETHDNPKNPVGYLETHDNPRNLKDKDKDKDKDRNKDIDKNKDKEIKIEIEKVIEPEDNKTEIDEFESMWNNSSQVSKTIVPEDEFWARLKQKAVTAPVVITENENKTEKSYSENLHSRYSV